MRTALDQQKAFAEMLVTRLAPAIGDELVDGAAGCVAEDRDRKSTSSASA